MIATKHPPKNANTIFIFVSFRYANNESFTRAIDDFEAALKINSVHANARKYLHDTLLAYGKS